MVNNKLVIAIDFDGTIFKGNWPDIGQLIPDADVYIKKLYLEGHHIIINTCRTGFHQGKAENVLYIHDIPYHYVNSNLPHLVQVFGQDSRKISADVYIDDKCLMGLPETWEGIYNAVQNIYNNLKK